MAAMLFLVILSATGVALNHSSDWALDRRYVSWSWALDVLGIHAPEPSATYSDRGHNVTQLGRRAYFDAVEIPVEIDTLRGLLVSEPLAICATRDGLILLTVDGGFVQHMNLSAELPGPIERIGTADGRPVIDAGEEFYVADKDLTRFVRWHESAGAEFAWSIESVLEPDQLSELQELYRGRGLTIERLLTEIHSGRIAGKLGPWLLDLIGLGFVLLSVSGLLVWIRAAGRAGIGRTGRR